MRWHIFHLGSPHRFKPRPTRVVLGEAIECRWRPRSHHSDPRSRGLEVARGVVCSTSKPGKKKLWSGIGERSGESRFLSERSVEIFLCICLCCTCDTQAVAPVNTCIRPRVYISRIRVFIQPNEIYSTISAFHFVITILRRGEKSGKLAIFTLKFKLFIFRFWEAIWSKHAIKQLNFQLLYLVLETELIIYFRVRVHEIICFALLFVWIYQKATTACLYGRHKPQAAKLCVPSSFQLNVDVMYWLSFP